MDRASATQRRGRAVTGDLREDWELERLRVEGAAEAFDVPVRAGCRSVGMSVAVARAIAELALRLLSREKGARCDDAYLEHVRVIALSAGVSGRIARAVKRADLLDHVAHRAVCPGGCPPPCGAALTVLMMVSASSQDAGSAWS